LRDEADDLAPAHADAITLGLPFDHLEGAKDRRLLVIHQVHRDLDDPSILQLESEGFHISQAAVAAANGARDPTRDLDIVRIEVHVVGDQRRARPDDGRSSRRMKARLSEVRRAIRIARDRLAQALELPFADVRQIHAIRARGRALIEIDGDLQLLGDSATRLSRQGDALLHRDAANGDEWDDIRRADAGVLSAMLVEVNEFGRAARGAHGGFHGSLRFGDEGDHRAVVISIHLAIEHENARDGLDGAHDLFDDFGTPPFAEVRDAFDDLLHRSRSLPMWSASCPRSYSTPSERGTSGGAGVPSGRGDFSLLTAREIFLDKIGLPEDTIGTGDAAVAVWGDRRRAREGEVRASISVGDRGGWGLVRSCREDEVGGRARGRSMAAGSCSYEMAMPERRSHQRARSSGRGHVCLTAERRRADAERM
jgi:hypothetical protein